MPNINDVIDDVHDIIPKTLETISASCPVDKNAAFLTCSKLLEGTAVYMNSDLSYTQCSNDKNCGKQSTNESTMNIAMPAKSSACPSGLHAKFDSCDTLGNGLYLGSDNKSLEICIADQKCQTELNAILTSLYNNNAVDKSM